MLPQVAHEVKQRDYLIDPSNKFDEFLPASERLAHRAGRVSFPASKERISSRGRVMRQMRHGYDSEGGRHTVCWTLGRSGNGRGCLVLPAVEEFGHVVGRVRGRSDLKDELANAPCTIQGYPPAMRTYRIFSARD